MNSQFMDAVIAACCFITSKPETIDPFKTEKVLSSRKNAHTHTAFSQQGIMLSLAELKECYDVDVEIGRILSINRLSMLKNKRSIKNTIDAAALIVGESEQNKGNKYTITSELYTIFLLKH